MTWRLGWSRLLYRQRRFVLRNYQDGLREARCDVLIRSMSELACCQQLRSELSGSMDIIRHFYEQIIAPVIPSEY
jgi:hypothetical protein